jgi:hypothetical protein
MRIRTLCCLPLLVALVAAFSLARSVAADVVHLKNGRTFDGVVAEEGEYQVRIRLEEGVLTLPRNLVEKIDKSDTSLAEFLRRKQELKQTHGTAQSWLDLAQWASHQGLSQAAREAALQAAALDPRLPGLAVILRSQGYELDPQSDRWISHDEVMRRRGFVLADGEWVSRRELADRSRAEQQLQLEEQSLYLQSQAAQASQDAALLMAQLQLSGPAGAYGAVVPGYGYGGVLLGAGYGAFGFGAHGHRYRPFFGGQRQRVFVPGSMRGQPRSSNRIRR